MFWKGLKHTFYRMKAWCCYVITLKSDGLELQSKSGLYLQRGRYDFIWEEKLTEFLLAHQRLSTKNESSKNSKYLDSSKSFNNKNDWPHCHSEQGLFSRRKSKSPGMPKSRWFLCVLISERPALGLKKIFVFYPWHVCLDFCKLDQRCLDKHVSCSHLSFAECREPAVHK